MNRIYERKTIFIIHKNEIQKFENFINRQSESNDLNISKILNSSENCRICLEISQPDLIQKYSTKFIDSTKYLELGEDNNVRLDYCIIFARDVNHIFPNHIELELFVLIDHRIQTDIDYRAIVNELVKSIDIKLIYRITDFEHYDLIWHNTNEMKIRLSNIESLENELELIEAVKIMKENVSSR